jgi:hypothetical protein
MDINPKPEPPPQKDVHLMTEVLNEMRDTITNFHNKETQYMHVFKLRHKILFAFLVFFAINLLWYGIWEIVSTIPILSNPYVAIILGGIILIGSGYFYENLISVNLNKGQRKKKLPESTPIPPQSDGPNDP